MGKKQLSIPSIEQIEAELKRLEKKKEYKKTFKGTVYILITVAAIAVLAAMLFMPVLHVTGSSMEPSLSNGEIVLALKNAKFHRGNVVAFYYNNKLLLKRVIGLPGDQIVIKDDGTVMVNGKILDEPYITDKGLGECDIDFPFQVPENRFFVMGDHRKVSIDSRSSVVGCISKEFIVGKVNFKIWPLSKIKMLQ